MAGTPKDAIGHRLTTTSVLITRRLKQTLVVKVTAADCHHDDHGLIKDETLKSHWWRYERQLDKATANS